MKNLSKPWLQGDILLQGFLMFPKGPSAQSMSNHSYTFVNTAV